MDHDATVIDTDPDILRTTAAAALHAAAETWTHIRAEVAAADGDYDALMTTLRAEGPYGYTIQPQINPDGTVRAPVLTTREEIRAAYEEVRGTSDLLSSEPLIEVRGVWYTFLEQVATGQLKAGGPPSNGAHVLALFPVGAGRGITGELVWPWVPRSMLGRGDGVVGSDDPLQVRRGLLALHDAYIAAFASGDIDALMSTMNADVQCGVRDYVADTGALIELVGGQATRAHYAAFFDAFEVLSVDLLHRVVQDWYVFAETRVVARSSAGDGGQVAFDLAEFSVIARDGTFLVRIGHGTDLALLA